MALRIPSDGIQNGTMGASCLAAMETTVRLLHIMGPLDVLIITHDVTPLINSTIPGDARVVGRYILASVGD